MNRPLIGVTPGWVPSAPRLSIHPGYMEALSQAGALPVLLPLTGDADTLAELVRRCDGIVLSGGADVDPRHYGEKTLPCCGEINPERDAMELALARLLAAAGKPLLGICRGAQVMNVALGGSLWQDLPAQHPGALCHRQAEPADQPCHSVQLKPGTRLSALWPQPRLRVNSLHHQAIRTPGAPLTVAAVAEDGVIEAVELAGHPFYVGVQWHPERLFATDEAARRLFRAFTAACQP